MVGGGRGGDGSIGSDPDGEIAGAAGDHGLGRVFDIRPRQALEEGDGVIGVEEPEDGEDEKHSPGHDRDLAELAEVDDLLEIDGTTAFDGLVTHGVDQGLRDIILVGAGPVLELHVGNQEGPEARVVFLHIEGGGYRVVGPEVAQPFAPEHPSQDSDVHQEEENANVPGHPGLGEEAPVDDEVDGEESDEPHHQARSPADIVPASLLLVGLLQSVFDTDVVSFGH